MARDMFSEADWRKELEAALRVAPAAAGGMTLREIAQQTGRSAKHTRLALHRLQAEGRLVVRRVARLALDGVMRAVPVYSFRRAK